MWLCLARGSRKQLWLYKLVFIHESGKREHVGCMPKEESVMWWMLMHDSFPNSKLALYYFAFSCVIINQFVLRPVFRCGSHYAYLLGWLAGWQAILKCWIESTWMLMIMLTIQTLKPRLRCEFKHPGASDQRPTTVPWFVCSCFVAVVNCFIYLFLVLMKKEKVSSSPTLRKWCSM